MHPSSNQLSNVVPSLNKALGQTKVCAQYCFLVLIAILILLLAGCGQSISPAPTTRSEAGMLAQGSLSVTSTVLPKPTAALDSTWDKATYIAHEGETREARVATLVAQATIEALTPTTPVPTPPPNPTPQPVDLPLGILGSPHLGFHLCDCSIENFWRGRLANGDYVEAYAGGWWAWVEQDGGVLVIEERTRNYLGSSGFAFFETPTTSGSVHIESYDGLHLVLRSANDTHFSFDVATRTWVDPLPTPKQ